MDILPGKMSTRGVDILPGQMSTAARKAGQRARPLRYRNVSASAYGRWPMPPSSVMVSPLMYLKSGPHSCTTTRPISASTSP